MIRFLPLFASVLASAMLFGAVAVPSAAAETGPTYRMVLASPAQGKFVAGETLWRCGTQDCAAGSGTSRPAIVCAQAARKLGKVESFTVKGEALSAEDLESCNKRAK